MTSVSAGHIILTPTQPVGSGRLQRGSNPGPPHQESRPLPTELPPPPPPPPLRETTGKCHAHVNDRQCSLFKFLWPFMVMFVAAKLRNLTMYRYPIILIDFFRFYNGYALSFFFFNFDKFYVKRSEPGSLGLSAL